MGIALALKSYWRVVVMSKELQSGPTTPRRGRGICTNPGHRPSSLAHAPDVFLQGGDRSYPYDGHQRVRRPAASNGTPAVRRIR